MGPFDVISKYGKKGAQCESCKSSSDHLICHLKTPDTREATTHTTMFNYIYFLYNMFVVIVMHNHTFVALCIG